MGEWDQKRQSLSRGATWLAGLVLKTHISDPMSGFFVVSRRAFEASRPRLSTIGFKILVDLVASAPQPRSFWCYIIARFTGAPIAFTKHIIVQAAQEYWRLISNWQFLTPQQRAKHEQYVAQNPLPIPAAIAPPTVELEMLQRARNALNGQDGRASESDLPDDQANFSAPPARSPMLSVPLMVFQVFSVIASLIAIASLGMHLLEILKLDPIWLSLGVIGVALQGALIITSAVEFAQARFVCGVWGLVCATAILAGAEIMRSAQLWPQSSGVGVPIGDLGRP